MFTRILLPTDFSTSANTALQLARRNFPDATRYLLHVLDPKRIASELRSTVSAKEEREAMEHKLLKQLKALSEPGEECIVSVGSAVETILDHTNSLNADLIVMGTHGRTGLAHFLNGSVAERVVRYADRPVLIEHEPQAENT